MDENTDRLDMLFDFFREIDKEKKIERQTPLTDKSRKENDAEHAWHASVMCLLLAEYSNVEIDKLRTVSMLLIHDLIEIYAGDTYAYDEEGKQTQRQRELEAADKLFGMLPEDLNIYIRGLWDEFEAKETPEAKFAAVMDRIQPVVLNSASDGISWLEHNVKVSQILERNKITPEGSEILWDYAREKFIEDGVRRGLIQDDR